MTGGCLCGAVRWSSDVALRNVFECHCDRCQRLTGNYMAATAAPTAELHISGATLRWYAPQDDANVAYGFCATCGSTLFFRSGVDDGTNDTTSICAGSIDGASGLSTSEIWFADSAADHVRLPDGDSIVQHATQP